MYIITRKNNGTIVGSENYQLAQASVNSDGKLTLRRYTPGQQDEELIVFDRMETQAIFELMSEIERLQQPGLPF